MTIQKFAWLPTRVWNMKTKNYRFTYIWLVWYYVDDYTPTCTFYKLTDTGDDQVPLNDYDKFRTNKNIW